MINKDKMKEINITPERVQYFIKEIESQFTDLSELKKWRNKK